MGGYANDYPNSTKNIKRKNGGTSRLAIDSTVRYPGRDTGGNTI